MSAVVAVAFVSLAEVGTGVEFVSESAIATETGTVVVVVVEAEFGFVEVGAEAEVEQVAPAAESGRPAILAGSAAVVALVNPAETAAVAEAKPE